MRIVHDLDGLRDAVGALRDGGKTLALVPTMGALHDGHLTLVREAARLADHVAASIFVNPTQFGANEDLDAYPRQLEEDCAMLQAEGVALVWAPGASVMYPPGFATRVLVDGITEDFCGATRPGHFDGVAQVVCKLFNQVQPDIAVFGEKDYQQLALIRRMARDLDLVRPHAEAIHGVPTVREADGLAMSSRNRYLSEKDRAAAGSLPRAMHEAIDALAKGSDVAATLAALEAHLLQAGFESVDYAALADPDTLQRLDAQGSKPARLLVAARIGGTRLIDNMEVPALNPALK